MDLALAPSLSSTKNSCNLDHKKSKSQSGESSDELLFLSIKASESPQLMKQELSKHSLIWPLIMGTAFENFHDLS